MEPVHVECTFTPAGVHVRRIQRAGGWQAVEQGRQWLDEAGRHLLIMIPGEPAQELLLRRETLSWELRPAGHSSPQII